MSISIYSKWFVLIAPYSLTVSTLYLLGYWGTFGINVFEYIQLTEIAKLALFHLINYGTFSALGVILSEIILGRPLRVVLPSGGGINLPQAKYFLFILLFISFITIVAALYLGLFTDKPDRWLRAGILMLPIIPLFMMSQNWVIQLQDEFNLNSSVIYLSFSIIFLSYGWGTEQARNVKYDVNTVIINKKESSKVYIGKAGEQTFFWDKRNSTVVMLNSKNIDSIAFTPPEEKGRFSYLFK